MQKITQGHISQQTCKNTHTQINHTHTVPALCCRIQTNRVNCQKTWHDLSDSLSINHEWDWRAFCFSAPSAPPAHSVNPRALNPPQIITLGGVSIPQDRAKEIWLWSWPILRVLSILNLSSQGFYYLNNSVTINWEHVRSSSCLDIFCPGIWYSIHNKWLLAAFYFQKGKCAGFTSTNTSIYLSN